MGVAGRTLRGLIVVAALVGTLTSPSVATTSTATIDGRGKVILFSPSLAPDDAQDLADLVAGGAQVSSARLAFNVTPAPPQGEPYSGALELETLRGGAPSLDQTVRGHLAMRRDSLLQSPDHAPEEVAYVESLLALSAPFGIPAIDLERNDPILESLVTSFAQARGYSTESIARSTTLPSGIEPTGAPSGMDGWAPDTGTWWFKYDRPVVNSFGVVLGHDYAFSATMAWSSSAAIQQLRGSDAKGFEFAFSFLHQAGRPIQSADNTRMASFMTDFPGAYQETVTVDDTNNTFGVGTHEAEKLRWVYQASPNFYENYFVDMKLQDPYDQRQQTPKAAFNVNAQYDADMVCGGSAAADACFFSNGGGNFVPESWCTYIPRDPANVVRWDYRGTTFIEQCPS